MQRKAISAVPFLLAAAHLVSLAGCSVKEDRELCPATLIVSLPAEDSAAYKLYIRHLTPEGAARETEAELSPEESEIRLAVPRSTFIAVAANIPLEDGRWLIPEGSPCRETYICRRRVTIRNDCALMKTVLQKEFCRMRIEFSSPPDGLSLRIRGRFCGSNLEGNLLEGMFLSPFKQGEDVCIPRQGDSSLLLDIENQGEGIVRTFALGEYLRKAGYDWEKENLDDVSIFLDYVRSEAIIATDFWTTAIPIDILL